MAGLCIRSVILLILSVLCFSIQFPLIPVERNYREWGDWPKLQCENLSADFCDSRFGCRVDVYGDCIFDPSLPTTPVDCAQLSMDVSFYVNMTSEILYERVFRRLASIWPLLKTVFFPS